MSRAVQYRGYVLVVLRILWVTLFLSNCRAAEENHSEGLGGPYYCYGDGYLRPNSPCRFFAVVIDAGSTGTRLHLYRYVHNTDPNGLPFLVEEEIFQEVKPGLSSFSSDPTKAAESVRILLDHARKTIPHFIWEKTPIALKATAGLRLLPGDLADDIMHEVRNEVFNSGFYAVPDAVTIMSGSDEGVYSWFTLNLLLNTMYSIDPATPRQPSAAHSVAAFDLGGGSTQVTFWPSHSAIFEKYPGYERDIDFFGNHIRLFTHSFLGNGLVAARLNVLLFSTPDDLWKTTSRLTSPCHPPGFGHNSWEYALKTWTINGTDDYSFDRCYEQVSNFVHHTDVMKLDDLDGKLIYLFSYFFDRGLNCGLVKDTSGGQIRLADFKAAAQEACQRTAEAFDADDGAHHWLPWQCLDLTYIYSLLADGYGFPDEQPIVLAKKISGMEVSWGQGLSYAVVDEFHEATDLFAAGKELHAANETVVTQLIEMIYSGTNHVLSMFNLIS